MADADWSDVTPVEEFPDDSTGTVLKVIVTPAYKQAMDLFRAVIASGELSHRVLMLTSRILGMCTAHYSVWELRRRCIKSPSLSPSHSLAAEWAWMEPVMTAEPKLFQSWHHRRDLLSWYLSDHAGELLSLVNAEKDATARHLRIDRRNYHVWQHRRWLVETFQTMEGEIPFVNHLLAEDVYNYSAWAYRMWLRTLRLPQGSSVSQLLALPDEAAFVLQQWKLAPDNESVAAYLQHLLGASIQFSLSPDVCEPSSTPLSPYEIPSGSFVSQVVTRMNASRADRMRSITTAAVTDAASRLPFSLVADCISATLDFILSLQEVASAVPLRVVYHLLCRVVETAEDRPERLVLVEPLLPPLRSITRRACSDAPEDLEGQTTSAALRECMVRSLAALMNCDTIRRPYYVRQLRALQRSSPIR